MGLIWPKALQRLPSPSSKAAWWPKPAARDAHAQRVVTTLGTGAVAQLLASKTTTRWGEMARRAPEGRGLPAGQGRWWWDSPRRCSTGEVAEASFDGGVAVVDGECKDALEHGGRTRRVRRLWIREGGDHGRGSPWGVASGGFFTKSSNGTTISDHWREHLVTREIEEVAVWLEPKELEQGRIST
jgi:hypothetical protein